jgi:hypothetical protein
MEIVDKGLKLSNVFDQDQECQRNACMVHVETSGTDALYYTAIKHEL